MEIHHKILAKNIWSKFCRRSCYRLDPEFEFGTNWSNYSYFVGDIFELPLAIEGIVAFFIEATFFAVVFFGWDKVSKKFHLASTWIAVFGAIPSAW